MSRLREFLVRGTSKKNIVMAVLVFFVLFGALFLLKYFQQNMTSEFKCGETLVDFEKNSYETLEIAGKCWMKEYLKSAKDSRGRIVQRSCYNEDESKCDEFGGLYTYQAAFNGDKGQSINGICPDGWRIPSTADYGALLDLYSKESCNLVESDTMGICELKEEFLLGSVFAAQYGGSCDLLCNYQNCSHVCSGISCRGAAIYAASLEGNAFAVGKRLIVNNCEPVKGKVDNLVGGFDSLISVRCVKK